MLAQNGADAIIWSTTITPPKGTTDTEALTAASTGLTAILGAPTGPLHAADRAWLSQQTALPDAPSLYVCGLAYMAWRDLRKPEAATAAKDCLAGALVAFPDDATALAEHAGVSAWLAEYQAAPGVDQVKLLADESTEVGRAVSLMPASSFAYQQQGLVLGRQGLLDAALGALKKSCDLNPASMDALVIYGLVQWANGDFADGAAATERAIAGIPSPPAYYYTARAFDALRQRRYYDAIDAAQALAAGDDELGPAIAMAAAPVIGRNDLIDRYRPVIMGNPHFQAGGIMTRIEVLYKTPDLVDRIREGLILAGIPPAALDGPFNADGTVRKP
jgi:tetratricopeptide (TPR) repeat protein